MKGFLIFLIFCFIPSFFLLGASEPQQVIEKLDSLERTISELSLRILALEKRIISLEEKILLQAAKGKDQTRKVPENLEQFEDDFSVVNVTYETDYNDTIFKGDISNRANKDFRYALFKISVYDKKGSVIASNDFYILNMDRGTKRSFEVKLRGVKANEFERYTIEFNKGS
ncbi:MAG: FxLYD domain-containing protein [Candidatus Scalinduaceae bacterium]